MADTHPASASVPVVGQQPAWRQSEAPVPEHERQAAKTKNSGQTATFGSTSELNFLIRKKTEWDWIESKWGLYLLHGDLWLSSYMLLGVADSCGVLVLRDSTYRSGGCCRWSGPHGLSCYKRSQQGDKNINTKIKLLVQEVNCKVCSKVRLWLEW